MLGIIAALMSLIAITASAEAATYSFTTYSSGTETATGTFGFPDSLLGTTVDRSQLTSFDFTYDGFTFDLASINAPSNFSRVFDFDTVSGQLLLSSLNPSISVAIGAYNQAAAMPYRLFFESDLGYNYMFPPPDPVPPPTYSIFIQYISLNPDGTIASVGPTGVNASLGDQLLIEPINVPEPSSVWLVLVGGIGLFGVSRLRATGMTAAMSRRTGSAEAGA